jgi:protein-S-isoprenylcysteine O-methyltransferase Ste14
VKVPAKRPGTTVRLGPLALTGTAAQVAVLIVFAVVVWLIALARPRATMLAAGAIWIAFIVYWSAAAAKAPPAERAESPASRQRHQMLLNVALLLIFVSIPGLRLALFRGRLVPVIGLGVEVAGALLYLWSMRELGRNWSGEISIKQHHRLVRSGPYARLRHPMYTALMVMAIGTAIVSNQLHAVFGVVLMAYAYVRKIGLEERWMREEFGAAYDEYRRASWALIPFVY